MGLDRIRRWILAAVAIAASLAAATAAVAVLERDVGVPSAAAVYFVAVVAAAIVAGAFGAVAAAIAAFVVYDYLFTEPFHTLVVQDPGEWLDLVLFLFVGIVVAALVSLQRSRAELASAREREARAAFRVSRVLATRPGTLEVLPELARILVEQAGMERVWITLGGDGTAERVVADTRTGPDGTITPAAVVRVLLRAPGDQPARWQQIHDPVRGSLGGGSAVVHRVRIEAAGTGLGSIWGLRARAAGEPDRTETRLLATAADQVGQALRQDRLATEAQAAAVARESDAVKSALLQSVSHDLRTPLATIRAAAGSLRRPGPSQPDRAASADAIEREVVYLDRLVTNLLDLSRIEAGALRPDLEIFELDDLVESEIERIRGRLDGRPVVVDIAAPPVHTDVTFLDQAISNALQNAIDHTPSPSVIRIEARDTGDGRVRVTIEDGGPGVPPEDLSHLFEKFHHVRAERGHARTGTGIGLAVARGLVEAGGGRMTARRSELGGLAIDIDIPVADVPAEVATVPS